MIVSWNWLKQYVLLDMPLAELEERLMMAGLNHERTSEVGGDLAIDLEVTSNRPDCLGHLGVAREIAVLWQRELKLPAAKPPQGKTPVEELTRVTVGCPDLCPRYTARVIRGVKVGPSPAWLAGRLATVGIASINNVVDVTNYVLMECGQPLHAFDLARLAGREIIVRRGMKAERFVAINHKAYELTPDMCVIADAKRAVGLGGVMGGEDTEVTTATADLLIEAAEFDPLAIRNTARALNLHSDSSYRFERGIDPEGVDWASRRCCELILEVAGGELAAGVIDVGNRPSEPAPIVLRFDQLLRILGIEVPGARAREILTALGCRETRATKESVEVVPPSWRRDLAREIDLVEEVARIHGYDTIPEDVRVPMAASARSETDRILERTRHILTAAGFDEAMTLSMLDERSSETFSPWTTAAPLKLGTPILRNADRLRRSLIPSLLIARGANEALANPRIELFEIAKAYHPRDGGLPEEPRMLALTSGEDFYHVKGTIEAVVAALHPEAQIESRPAALDCFASQRGAELWLNGQRIGFLGEVSDSLLKQFELRAATTVAEVWLEPLVSIANLVPQYVKPPQFPAITRDLNLVVEETVLWADLAATVRESAGPLLEALSYLETYRSGQLGPGKKSMLFTMTLRDRQGTLKGEQADEVRDQIVAACGKQHGAQLRA